MMQLDKRLGHNFVLKRLCLLRDNVTMCLRIVQCTEVGFKVEKFLKGNLYSIPSPSSSVKIQIMHRKVCWALSTNF